MINQEQVSYAKQMGLKCVLLKTTPKTLSKVKVGDTVSLIIQKTATLKDKTMLFNHFREPHPFYMCVDTKDISLYVQPVSEDDRELFDELIK